jgi:hypothetical protein
MSKSDPSAGLGDSLTIRMISCSNVPIANVIRRNCDPYCKVFVVGPIKSFIGQTRTISGTLDATWDQTIVTNSVRGLRLYFELFDEEDTRRDQLLGYGTFNPNFHHLTTEVELPLFTLKKYDKARHEPTILKFSVTHTTKVVNLQPPPSIIRNPIYLTLTTNNPIRMRTPYDLLLDPGVRGILPYVFPCELCVVLLNEATSTYEVISSANRVGKGAWHSGKNICGGCESISPCIRLDPAALISSGVRTFFITVSSWDFSDLKTQLNTSGAIVVWKSREKSNAYKKSDRQSIGTRDLQDLGIAARFTFQTLGPETLIACVRGQLSGTDQVDLIEFQPPFMIPTPDYPVFVQTPSEVVPIIVRERHLSASQFAARQQLPLFVPRSLMQVGSSAGKMEVQARAGAYRAHPLQVVAADANLRVIWSCKEDRSPVVTGGALKQGVAKVQLNLVQDNVEFLMFLCYGEQVLGDEIHADQQQLLVLVNGSFEIIKAPYKYSRMKNALLWFVLAKDGFAGWAVVNLRLGIVADSEEDAVGKFMNVAQAVLKY